MKIVNIVCVNKDKNYNVQIFDFFCGRHKCMTLNENHYPKLFYGSFIDSAPLMFYEIFQNEVRRKQIHKTFDNSVTRIVLLHKK